MDLCDLIEAAGQRGNRCKRGWRTVLKHDLGVDNPFKPGDKVVPKSCMVDGRMPEVVPSILIVEQPLGDHTLCYVDRGVGHRDSCTLETDSLIKIGSVTPVQQPEPSKYKLADSWYLDEVHKTIAVINTAVTNYNKENR
ncbi:MAG: hypothetical protein WC261_08285 [Synergistaceae bacterium]|jgi:hypothetical protein